MTEWYRHGKDHYLTKYDKYDERRFLLAYAMKCYRNMLNVGWQKKQTKAYIRAYDRAYVHKKMPLHGH